MVQIYAGIEKALKERRVLEAFAAHSPDASWYQREARIGTPTAKGGYIAYANAFPSLAEALVAVSEAYLSGNRNNVIPKAFDDKDKERIKKIRQDSQKVDGTVERWLVLNPGWRSLKARRVEDGIRLELTNYSEKLKPSRQPVVATTKPTFTESFNALNALELSDRIYDRGTLIVQSTIAGTLGGLTADGDFYEALDGAVKHLVDRAMERAAQNDRNVVQARDI